MSQVASKPRFALRLISGEAKGPAAAALRGVLWLLSLLYGLGLALYLLPYRLGVRKRKRLPCKVISIGNITFGGTGKTPVVRTIAAEMVARGVRPVILSRGYGGKGTGRAAIVSDGGWLPSPLAPLPILGEEDGRPSPLAPLPILGEGRSGKRRLSVEECGDEPAMLADLLPGVPVVIGKDRRESGRLAVELFNPDVMLLDDGMQYWQLHRDVDVALVNAVEPFGYGNLLPRGALREPVSGLRRAGAILITNSDKLSEDRLDNLTRRLKEIAPRSLVVKAAHKTAGLRELGGQKLDIDWLRGRRVGVFCSIGTPGLFAESMAALGAEVVRRFDFPDHHVWRPGEIEAIAEEAAAAGAEALVTTEKDAVKVEAGGGVVSGLQSRNTVPNTGVEGVRSVPIAVVDVVVEFDRRDFVSELMEMVGEVGPEA